jgi:hypothetical protein
VADEILVVREVFDRVHASDGHSRYGVYLRQHARYFDDDRGPTADPVEFASAAFAIARTPIMGPPYVGTHPRVVHVEQVWDVNDRCGVSLGFAVPTTERIAGMLPVDVAGWQRDGSEGPYYAPERLDRTAAYTQLVVRIPFPQALLPVPAYSKEGLPNVDVAKRAVRTICNHANSLLAHLLGHL